MEEMVKNEDVSKILELRDFISTHFDNYLYYIENFKKYPEAMAGYKVNLT